MRHFRIGLFAAGLAGVSALAVALAAPPTGNSGADLAGAPGSVKPIPRPAASPSPRPSKVVAKPAPQLASKPAPQVAAKPSPAPQTAERSSPASGAIDLRAPPPQVVTRDADRDAADQQAERDLAGAEIKRPDRAEEDDRTGSLARDEDRDGDSYADRDEDGRYADRDNDDDRYARRDDRDGDYAGRDSRMLGRDWRREEARDYERDRRPDYRDAVRSCERAGLSEARDRRFYSIEYVANPRLVETRYGYEVRGRVELEDRRGFVRMESTCALEHGRAVDFRLFR